VRARKFVGITLFGRIASTARYAGALFVLTAIAVVAPITPAAAALQPIDLSVVGGEENWHPERRFSVHWTNPPGVTSVHYRLLDQNGNLAQTETALGEAVPRIESIEVHGRPGVYRAEIWLEAGNGTLGDPVTARLRFDDTAPGSIEATPVAGWIGRTAFPYTIQLSHPSAAALPSGIRGYAVSVDRDADGAPCASATCTDGELDLRGGVDDDRIAIGELPEGTWYLHAVAVSGAGIASDTPGTTALHVDKTDPTTRLSGVPDGWSREPVSLTAIASDLGSGMAPAGGPVPFTAIAVDGAPPVIGLGSTVSLTLIGSGAHTVAYFARDGAGNVADGNATNGLINHDPATTVVRIDREPPHIAFAGAQDPRDPEQIEAHSEDQLSGLDLARGSIEVRPANSGARFRELDTEARGGTLRARWSSESWPPGEYEFRATAYDMAGNAASTLLRANGSPMHLSAPLKPAPRLLTQLCDRGTWLTGRAVVGRSAPLSGLTVAGQRISYASTDGGGRFRVRLAPGPSREILVQSPSTSTLRAVTSPPLRIATPAQIHLRVSSAHARIGGRPIVFSGRIDTTGAHIPSDGKVVDLEFRLPGLPWREFRAVRTDRRGRFRYAYRFADDDSRGARFQFRAVAPAQAGWPYEPAGSKPVTVLGV